MPYLHMQDVVQISLSRPDSPHLNIIQDHLPLASKFKNLFKLGIPRIELGTLRSLSVHFTTRLNPQQCYICVSDKFQTKKNSYQICTAF